jgi:DNA-binding winged helix-turn-helix (wHTH) protein
VPLSRCCIRDANIDVRPDLGCLLRSAGEEIYLRPKTFQTLLLLIEHRDRIVTKDEIIERLWPGTAVTDDTLVQSIVEIRKALGDDARQGRFVRTLPKSGYRFVGHIDFPSEALPVTEPLALNEDAMPRDTAALQESIRSQLTVPGRLMSRVLIAATVLAAALVSIAAYLKNSDTGGAQDLSETLAAGDAHRSRIAVMFLDNESSTPELEWLRGGLVDMLVTGLSRSRRDCRSSAGSSSSCSSNALVIQRARRSISPRQSMSRNAPSSITS